MIVAELKPFDEIRRMLKGYNKVMVLGCGTCVTVSMTGGERQVNLLSSAIRMAGKLEGNDLLVGEKTILRQCDPEFIDQITEEAVKYEAILSLACGAGVQGVAEKLGNACVLPAMNTTFIGLTDGKGAWVEVCSACGNCILHETGGICPVTRCAKGLMNGPCGGSQAGLCEISRENPCVWQLIYMRIGKPGIVRSIQKTAGERKMPAHPRRMVREDLIPKRQPERE